MDLDLRHRRIVFAGTDVVLVVKPLNRANYQRCVAEFGRPDVDLAARMALAAEVLREQVVRVEGLTVTPETGDPHPITVFHWFDVFDRTRHIDLPFLL